MTVSIGDKFNRWTVIGQPEGLRNLCRCSCGTEKMVNRSNLIRGQTKSCGCHMREISATINLKHGMTGTREYGSWQAMVKRCTNPKYIEYDLYGGRGITVCDRWLNSFEAFYADMGARPEGQTLDRIDNDGNYEPGNCRWATPQKQSMNQRTRSNCKSGCRGVSFDSAYGKWRANIWIGGKRAYSAFFDTKEEAIKARKDKELYFDQMAKNADNKQKEAA